MPQIPHGVRSQQQQHTAEPHNTEHCTALTQSSTHSLAARLVCGSGNLVKVLLHTKVTKYLEFKSVTGSYVVKGGKAHKVPATPTEALASPLMGMFQKRKFKNFVEFVNDFDEKTPATQKGVIPTVTKTKEVYGQPPRRYHSRCNTQPPHSTYAVLTSIGMYVCACVRQVRFG